MPWHEHRRGPGTWCVVQPRDEAPAVLAGILWRTATGDYCGFQRAHVSIDVAPFDEIVAAAPDATAAYEQVKALFAPGALDVDGTLDTWARQ